MDEAIEAIQECEQSVTAVMSDNKAKYGISALHGGHHVAQKSSITTFPLVFAAKLYEFPFKSLREKSGAACLEFAGWQDIKPTVASISSMVKRFVFISFLWFLPIIYFLFL